MAIQDTPGAARWLGEQIRTWREAQGLTFTTAAARIGISRSALGKIENARCSFPRDSIATIASSVGIPPLHIACAYRCTLAELLDPPFSLEDGRSGEPDAVLPVREPEVHPRWNDTAYWASVQAPIDLA